MDNVRDVRDLSGDVGASLPDAERGRVSGNSAMVTGSREEEFARLLRLVPELWALMGDETLACVGDCLAVFTGAVGAGATPASLLPALQRLGLLSSSNVLLLRQVSQLVGCGGAVRLLDDFQRRHPPPQPARPAPGRPPLTLSTVLSVSDPATSSGNSRQQSPPTGSDSFRSAIDSQQCRRTTEQRCPWVWPRAGDTGRQGLRPARLSVREVLELPWDVLERPDTEPRRRSDEPVWRPAPVPASPGVRKEQMHWLEKVLAWEVHPEPAAPSSGSELTAFVSQLLSRDGDVQQISEVFREGSRQGSETYFAGYATCC